MEQTLRTCCERTSLEQVLSDLLKQRKIEFVEQYPTKSGFVLDFIISPNFVIETDGPCHNSSKSKKHDKFRDKILKTEGYIIYRINYKYFYDMDLLNEKLDKILGEICPISKLFQMKSVPVQNVLLDQVVNKLL
jgi:very-short-patch-repair endonuclease